MTQEVNTTTTNDAFVPTFMEYPVYPEDIYTATLINVDITKRKRYKSEEQEDCYKMVFEAIDIDDATGEVKPRLFNDKPIKFVYLVSMNYGTSKAMLTRLVTGICGFTLTKEQLFDLRKLIGQIVKLNIVEQVDGDKRTNVLASIRRYTGDTLDITTL